MYKEFEYKKQGDGSDSWTVTEWKNPSKKIITNKYMVYEDPAKIIKQDISNIDLTTLTFEHWNQLRAGLGLKAVSRMAIQKTVEDIKIENIKIKQKEYIQNVLKLNLDGTKRLPWYKRFINSIIKIFK